MKRLVVPISAWHRSLDPKQYLAIIILVFIVGFTGVRFLSPSQAASDGTWASGSSYYSDSQTFGSWRGSTSTIFGCWADARDSAATQSSASGCMSGQAAAGYKYDIDLAVGFIVNGESMSAAASGAYDARWRTMADSINANWGQARTVYIRPAHEMNGNWYPWSVTNANSADFKKAFIRYSNIIKTQLKDKGKNAKVTLSYNWDSNPSGVSIDTIWPGDQYVDVVGVDRYDVNYSTGNPGCNKTEANWNDVLSYNDKAGNYGLNNWLAFASAHGKPVGFPEWGLSDKAACDNPFWITKMHDYFAAHAGTGPGQIAFEVYFNIGGYGATKLYPNPESPNAANTYKSLKWGNGGAISPTPTPTPPSPTPTPPTPPPSSGGQISQVDNLAAGKTFIASVGDNTDEPGNTPNKVSDANESSRWISAAADNVTLSVDLAAPKTLSKVSILWAGDTTNHYSLQVSADNATWTTIATGATNNSTPQLINTTTFTSPATGRYFRVVAVDRHNLAYGNSIYEIGLYGVAATVPPAAKSPDLNGDGKVNLTDLSLLLSQWNKSGSADLNNDGVVNLVDLSQLLSAWNT